MSTGQVEERAPGPIAVSGAGLVETLETALPIVPSAPASRLQRLLRHREVRRLVAFLVAGGISALVTISVTALLTNQVRTGFLLAAIAGTELGILVNFSINDRLAFRDLDGQTRPLLVRVVRFHVTCALGQTLILLFSLVLHDVVHWNTITAQALPIGVVTVVNFVMHRFWTYRGASKHV
ncbi:MAG: GtrA family protein [Ktedonobacterales bacterium]